MSLLSSLIASSSGLRAASAGVAAVSHNVANAANPAFSRRSLSLSTAPAITLGGALLGAGVRVSGEVRAGSVLVSQRRVDQAGLTGAAGARAAALATVERSLADTGADGLRGAVDGFFDALDATSARPGDVALRREVLNHAESVAGRISSGAGRVSAAMDSMDEELAGLVQEINGKLVELADVEELLARSAGRVAVGDLEDRRDRLVYELTELLGARARASKDGLDVLLGGNGLLGAGEARQLELGVDADGAPSLALRTGSGEIDVTDLVGGAAGGLLAARDQAAGYLAELDQVAVALADAVNAQHALGFDRAGAPGGAVFTYAADDPAASLALDAAVADHPERLALAGAASALPGDAGNLAGLLAVEQAATVDGVGVGEALGALSARVGADLAAAAGDASHQAALASDLEDLHQSIVGVDLDEQAARLLEHQAAYQASAKVIAATDALLSTLIELV